MLELGRHSPQISIPAVAHSAHPCLNPQSEPCATHRVTDKHRSESGASVRAARARYRGGCLLRIMFQYFIVNANIIILRNSEDNHGHGTKWFKTILPQVQIKRIIRNTAARE